MNHGSLACFVFQAKYSMRHRNSRMALFAQRRKEESKNGADGLRACVWPKCVASLSCTAAPPKTIANCTTTADSFP